MDSSDRALEVKSKHKKKKKRRHDSDIEAEQRFKYQDFAQCSPDAARSHGTDNSCMVRQNGKRHYDDSKDAKHDNGCSPEKRRRIDYSDDDVGDRLASCHTSPMEATNGAVQYRLNRYTAVSF